jgi:F0F1-type ATP synthase epsilon subunit
LRLTVLTPAEQLLEVEEVRWVRVRLVDGAGLSIYPGHAPLLAETVPAPVRYSDSDGEHEVDVASGVLHVTPYAVTLFTGGGDGAEPFEPAEDEQAERFDRLARTLLETLDAAPPEGRG